MDIIPKLVASGYRHIYMNYKEKNSGSQAENHYAWLKIERSYSMENYNVTAPIMAETGSIPQTALPAGVKSFKIELTQVPTVANGHVAICRAKVVSVSGEEFQDIGACGSSAEYTVGGYGKIVQRAADAATKRVLDKLILIPVEVALFADTLGPLASVNLGSLLRLREELECLGENVGCLRMRPSQNKAKTVCSSKRGCSPLVAGAASFHLYRKSFLSSCPISRLISTRILRMAC